MSILITGGIGYIGSHTAIELLNIGEDIIIIDNLSNSKKNNLKRIEKITNKKVKFYEVDLLDKKALEKVFRENNIKEVLHFAALKDISESIKEPIKYYINNVVGTLNLLQIMEKNKCYKIVFSSSATVYGKPKKLPINEDAELASLNPYGITKIMIERILKDIYNANSKFSIIILRYFNPIGAHSSGLIGEDSKGKLNNIMPYINQVAIGKIEYFNIYGQDYNTKDGTGIRDYIHVVDLAKGHLKAIKKVRKITGIKVYNLGTGKGYSVLDLIKNFEKVNNEKIKYIVTDRRIGDIGECYADVTKAKEELGWTAEKGIEEMCADAWRFTENMYKSTSNNEQFDSLE